MFWATIFYLLFIGIKGISRDFNNDGLLDVGFFGEALIYCEGLETGYGRKDVQEKRRIKLNVKFNFYQGWNFLGTDDQRAGYNK